ncbi:protein E6 [Cucurbita moschata]|uniref:Protein E6 n=1 Tax=Cucurbita moschata TaxID=3662 RepID=A0A6J1EM79_CUCMO|nr:protein E6 [Cucurbita moschata]
MASSTKLLSLFLLSLFFIQIHGRESNFFSKVPNNNGESQIPNKVDPLTNSEKTTTPQDQDPNFIPQTQDNGYGLYGHESGQFSPSDAKFSDPNARTGGRPFSTTTTYDDGENNYKRNDDVSYKSESEEYYNYNNNYNNDNFQNSNWKKPYENSFYYNKDLYDNRRQSFQNTRLSRNEYATTTTTTPSYDEEKYNDDNNNNNFYANNRNDNENNVARQGMSDTRFMENGKYFYDLHREPQHQSRSSRNNFRNNNNYNTYEYGNSMGRYQNDETEFQEESDEFVP